VNTVDDEPQELLIPPGTQSGKVLTLESKGVPKLGNPVSRGDHLITISIDIPTKISLEERELLEKLAKLRGDRIGKSGIEGFFGKVFGA
jgi:molecular chaperone DnaJ